LQRVEQLRRQDEFLAMNRIDLIDLNTSQAYVDELVRFFSVRERRLRSL
jgi:hypothetical protein